MNEITSRADKMRDLAAVRIMALMTYHAYQMQTLAMKERVESLTGPKWGYSVDHPEVVSANMSRLHYRDLEFKALDYIAEINEKYDLFLREVVAELAANYDALAEALAMLEIKALPLSIDDLIKGGKAF